MTYIVYSFRGFLFPLIDIISVQRHDELVSILILIRIALDISKPRSMITANIYSILGSPYFLLPTLVNKATILLPTRILKSAIGFSTFKIFSHLATRESYCFNV